MNITKDYILGFMKTAADHGLSQVQSAELFKQKHAGQDPAALMAQMQQGGDGQPPQDPSQQGAPDMSGGLPQPPPQGADPTANPELAQLEQLLQSLPPEQLQQIIQQIQQELQQGGGGQPPQDPSQAAFKQAAYIEEFFNRGFELGLSRQKTAELYNDVANYFEAQKPVQQVKVAEDNSNSIRFEAMIKRANELGFTREQAIALYNQEISK